MSENKEQAAVEQENRLCVNGCGFFGSATTNYLCSKCYEKHRRSQDVSDASKSVGDSQSIEISGKSVSMEKTSVPSTPVMNYKNRKEEVSPSIIGKNSQTDTYSPSKRSIGQVDIKIQDTQLHFPNQSSSTRKPSPESLLVETTDNGIAKQKSSNRCAFCKRKVGFTGMECKCRLVFCSSHRYPEQHNCTFDFKTEERKNLERTAVGGGVFSKVDHL